MSSLPPDLANRLIRLRNADGGFPPVAGGASEPEPTALAAIALDDAAARGWLERAQRADGGFIVGPAAVSNDSPTPLAALALSPGSARERAVDYVAGHQAPRLGFDERFPHDPETRGWGWTSRTFGWVEPTARGLLVMKLLRPAAREQIADGDRVLSDRECRRGGWNYGNREVLGTAYEPYLQTTASGLLAVQDRTDPLRDRAVAVIRQLWRAEAGGLGWAMSLAALHANGLREPALETRLTELVGRTNLLGDTVALAWAAIALGPAIERLRIRR